VSANSLLILACIAASFWAWLQDPRFVERTVIFSLHNLEEGRIWTLVTALFVHGNVIHLVGNMIFLLVFGGTLQSSLGAARHLLVFFTGGVAAFLLSAPFTDPEAGMLGASAAIFTVAACVMLVKPLKFSWLFLAPQGLVAILYFLYNVLVVYNPALVAGYDPRIGYVPHIIGFVIGLPFGIAWSEHWRRNLLFTAGLLLLYIALLALLAGLV
jgi:membrane associated rhomboid family serine protease